MKFTNRIIIERPLEKVFLWMFQPHHIVQLITRDHSQDGVNTRPIPTYVLEIVSKKQRFLGQTETVIEIKNLSTPTLQTGTTFRFVRGVRGEYIQGVKGESEGYQSWKSPAINGTISIKKSVSSTFFFFTAKGFVPSADHHLTFQAQQGKTIMTYKQSMLFGEIQFRALSQVSPALLPMGNEEVSQQLRQLKTQMEVEID